MINESNSASCKSSFFVQKTLLDGWVDGWKEDKAGLRITYSNQKFSSKNLDPYFPFDQFLSLVCQVGKRLAFPFWDPSRCLLC